MARERWLIDGYELTDGTVMDVEYREGLYQTAPLVGANGVVPNRSGEVWRPKRRGPATFTLNLWVGTDGTRDTVDALYDNLIRVVGDGSRLPRWNRYLADGTVRETYAEVVGAMSPQPSGQQMFRLGLEVNVPSGIWESPVDDTQSTVLHPASGAVLTLDQFAKTTAPMERLTYQISGPAVDATVTDVTNGNGDWFKYVGTIPGGATLTVNSETWDITAQSFTVDRASFYHNGPRFLTLPTPMVGQFPRVRFDYSNGGSTSRLTVTGRRAFAV